MARGHHYLRHVSDGGVIPRRTGRADSAVRVGDCLRGCGQDCARAGALVNECDAFPIFGYDGVNECKWRYDAADACRHGAHPLSLNGRTVAQDEDSDEVRTMKLGPSAVERMAVYERTTGLKPSGLHRRDADELMRGVSRRCTHCAGDGYFLAGKGWLWCEACGGLGRVLTPRAQLLLRRRVVEKYPAAAVSGVAIDA